MEASEKMHPRRRNDDALQGVLRPIGDDCVSRALTDHDHAVGIVRLNLMVNTVLPRLTGTEDRPCES